MRALNERSERETVNKGLPFRARWELSTADPSLRNLNPFRLRLIAQRFAQRAIQAAGRIVGLLLRFGADVRFALGVQLGHLLLNRQALLQLLLHVLDALGRLQ